MNRKHEAKRQISINIDADLVDFVYAQKNITRYVNDLIRANSGVMTLTMRVERIEKYLEIDNARE